MPCRLQLFASTGIFSPSTAVPNSGWVFRLRNPGSAPALRDRVVGSYPGG